MSTRDGATGASVSSTIGGRARRAFRRGRGRASSRRLGGGGGARAGVDVDGGVRASATRMDDEDEWTDGGGGGDTDGRDDALASTSMGAGVVGADVFVAATPLDGFERAATSALGARTGVFDRHWMVLVRHVGDKHAAVYDFLPKNPRSPVTAAKLLAGGRVPGETRARRLAGVPSARCCFVGKTRSGLGGRIAIESAVVDFHSRWDEGLVLGSHDCRDHASELAKWLTCEYGEGVEVSTTADGTLTCEKTCTLGVDDENDEDDDDDDDDDDDGVTVARRTTNASKKKSTAKKKK